MFDWLFEALNSVWGPLLIAVAGLAVLLFSIAGAALISFVASLRGNLKSLPYRLTLAVCLAFWLYALRLWFMFVSPHLSEIGLFLFVWIHLWGRPRSKPEPGLHPRPLALVKGLRPPRRENQS